MPSNVIAFSRIEKNKENKTGKHYTKDELQKREKAEKSLRRKSVKLTAPAWLKTENKKPAYAIWKELLKQSADIGLFDDVDALKNKINKLSCGRFIHRLPLFVSPQR